MTPKIKIIPLGGLGEIGKNMTAYECGTDIIVVDCGLGFPDEQMYGIDIVIPDISYLKANADRVRGIILTHGHEDHIGAIPYVMTELDVPIYATPLTAALVELKLEEHDLLYNTQIFTKKAGDVFRLGCFSIEFINVNHSIADAVALAIKTPLGTIVHTGDFKIDVTPVQGKMIDLPRLGQLGNVGVLALLSDSTNVEKPGHSASERKVGETFDMLFKNCDQRIIITTFASNVHRLQQIIDVAAKYKRKVGITGRSMENILRVASVLGYLNIPEDTMVDINHINKLPKNKVVIISTGSQGETMSALYRMAFSEHRQINIEAGDRVIISASAIPGNENMISKVIDELFHKGAEVIYDRNTELHVSGHASQEEQKMMLALTKPKYFIPVYGDYRLLVKHAEIGKMMGVQPKNVVIGENGKVIEITKTIEKYKSTLSETALNFLFFLGKLLIGFLFIVYFSEIGGKIDDPVNGNSWITLFIPFYIMFVPLIGYTILHLCSLVTLFKGKMWFVALSIIPCTLSFITNSILIPLRMENRIGISAYWFPGLFTAGTVFLALHMFIVSRKVED